MTLQTNVRLQDVQAVYDGAGGQLWELVMGEQIHSGGPETTEQLAAKAGLKAGMTVLDICSALGGPARHLAKQYGVTVVGIDATPTMVNEATKRTIHAGLNEQVEFRLGDALDLPIEDERFDVVWGQEAWCYVTDKDRLVHQAARALKPGGLIAFTDWIITGKIADSELETLYASMTFPYMESFQGYQTLLEKHGLDVQIAEDQTAAFARCFDEYNQRVHGELAPVIRERFGPELFEFASDLVKRWQAAAHNHQVGRGLFVGKKRASAG